MKVTLELLRRALVTLEPARFAHLTRSLLKAHLADAGDREDVPLSWQIRLALADWMSHLGFLSDHQQIVILVYYAGEVERWCGYVTTAEGMDGHVQPPGLSLTVSDGRWVHTNFCVHYLDLQSEEKVDSLPGPPVTHVTVDALALHWRLRDRLQRLGGSDAAAADQPVG